MHFTGLLYRALNPIYAQDPLSGEGARRHGGRECLRSILGTLQPTMLVAYQADIGPIFDATNKAALDAEGVTAEKLSADDWRLRMLADSIAPTQDLARRLKGAGFAGLQVRSFAKGTTEQDLNLVLWNWGADLPTQLLLMDDEGRLG